MKNKLILGLVIATLAFTAIGCGAKDTQASDTQKENTETETTNGSPEDTSSDNTPTEDVTTEENYQESEATESETNEPETNEPESTESETTPPSDESTGALPFEGIYWYVEEEGFDDPEFPIPDVREGRYYDGTNAYYYYQYGSEPTVYQYKVVNTETSGGIITYYIELYQNGSQVDSDSFEMGNGKISIIKDYGGFGGIYQFEQVDSLDNFYN